jgi:hypothetical protein
MYYVSRIFGTAALAALGTAVWFSIVLARADFYFREGKVQRATEIAPRNTEYLALRALQLEYDGADAGGLREKIVALNPLSSAPRIRLGLAAEVAGDSARAETWLLDAARVDHQFEPRWTLANFYFRAGKKTEFWKWMRAAFEVSYGDRTPAYELCWRVSSDGSEILRLAIPDRREVVGSYLVYLLSKKPADSRLPPKLAAPQDVVEVVRSLARYRDDSDLPLLFGACDELLAARDAGALEVWVLTGQSAPSGIFNGDFASAPLNHGFDWRAIESLGVTHVNLNPGHRIALSGQEAETGVLLKQALSLVAGKRYRLQWESRTAGIKAPSGLEWRVAGYCPLPDGRGSVGAGCAALSPSEDWMRGEMTIDATDRFQILEFAYQRSVGESRAEGNIEIRHVRLVEAAP